jgi:hypothetical protein
MRDLTGIALIIVGVAVHRAGPGYQAKPRLLGGLRARRRTASPMAST